MIYKPTAILFPILLFAFLLWVACSSPAAKNNTLPPLSREAFKNVLTDMHLAEALAQSKQLKREEAAKNALPDFLAQVLCIHNITAADFTQSLTYYSTDFKDLDKIYEEIISDLGKKEAQWQTLAQKEKPTIAAKDSTQKQPQPNAILNRDHKALQVQIDRIKKGNTAAKPPIVTDKDK